MKKIILACLFMFSCTLIPVSANNETETNGTKTVKYTEDGIPIINIDDMVPSTDIDLSDGLSVQHSPLPFAYGDIIYNDYYVKAPAWKSIDIGYFIFGYAGDRVLLEWDGATESNPKIDVVIKFPSGEIFSIYDNYGDMINRNAGSMYIESNKASQVHIWFSSYNDNDVTFYRVTTKDGAR